MPDKNLSSSSRIRKTKKEKVSDWEGLPKTYGDTRIVLLPRDPYWVFSYWDISEKVKSKLRKEWGTNALSHIVLRVYDITDIKFNGANAHKYFDVYISENADNWYINVPEANRNWCVDLGLLFANGRFVVIARSNIVIMPKHGVSQKTDTQWAIMQEEFDRLLSLSGLDKIGKSSFDVTKLMKERWEQLVSISSAQMPFSRRGAPSIAGNEAKAIKQFWLKADTELIVYGATESDAHLTIGNDTVPVGPDGSFSIRITLPDGVKKLPIKAVSRDSSMAKKITFKVARETK